MRYPLNVPTSKDKIYGQFLRIINFLVYDIDDSGNTQRAPLTNKELDVLSSMMYYNDKYRNLPPEERADYIMSSDIRKRIRAKLDIKANHLNNILSRLKTKLYMGTSILKEGKLCDALNIYLDEDTTIEFNLEYEKAKQSIDKPDRVIEKPSGKVQLKVRQSQRAAGQSGGVVEPFNLDD